MLIDAASHSAGAAPAEADPSQPRDDDERFVVGLVLSYYRRDPQRARTRLLDLLGEVLAPPPPTPPPPPDERTTWQQAAAGVAPLKPRRR
jgi:hypothetical protein